jgi:hypothetical protein
MSNNDKKQKHEYYNQLDSTNVDLSRSDCYDLCYKVINGIRAFDCQVGEFLLVERYNPGCDNEFNQCRVLEINNDEHTILLWDEVREQKYFINLCDENLPYLLRSKSNIKFKKKRKIDINQ